MTETATLTNKSVYVESEFAPLKRAILSQSEYVSPQPDGSEDTGNDYLLFLVRREREELRTLLERYGVEVLVPRKLTAHEKRRSLLPDGPTGGCGLSNFFSRDPIFVVGNNIIELNLNTKIRRQEVLAMQDILFSESAGNHCRYLSMPRSNIFDGDDRTDMPFLEGGDLLLNGKTVYVGISDGGSNISGYRWLRSYLSTFGYEVKPIRIQGKVCHLDCVISLVRDGLMLVSREHLPEGLPAEFSSWDQINVAEKDAEYLAVNGLPVNGDVYLTDIAFRDTVGRELEKRGVQVEYLDFKFTRALKGSFHCSVNPLLRKGF